MQSPKRVKGKGRGSCPQYEFERVLNLERSSFGVRSYGKVQCPPTLLPSSGTDWLLWEVSL